MSKPSNNKGRTTLTSPTAASRAQKAVARTHGGEVPKGNYTGRLQAAAARNFGKSGSS